MLREHEGLGDTVYVILKSLGLQYMKDCGCDKRRQWLNTHFSYNGLRKLFRIN